MTVTPTTGPSDQATETLVRTLRDDMIPRATKDADMTADVGGTTAGDVDLADEISGGLVLTIAVVVLLSILLLTLAFRSIVIPLTAGVMNLISIGAAFGVVTAVFEKGWGLGLVGLDSEVAIVATSRSTTFAASRSGSRWTTRSSSSATSGRRGGARATTAWRSSTASRTRAASSRPRR